MKQWYTIFVICVFACNAGSNSSNNSSDSFTKKGSSLVVKKDSTYTDFVNYYYKKQPVNDTMALGFVLNENENRYNENLHTLIKNGKLGSSQTLTHFSKVILDDTYPYELYINDSATVHTVLFSTIVKDKLVSIGFAGLSGSINDVLPVLSAKYGQYNFKEIDSSTQEVKTYYWFDGYKQISLSSEGYGIYQILYDDLNFAHDLSVLKLQADSLKKKIGKESKNDL